MIVWEKHIIKPMIKINFKTLGNVNSKSFEKIKLIIKEIKKNNRRYKINLSLRWSLNFLIIKPVTNRILKINK